jgi:hypothetical protein
MTIGEFEAAAGDEFDGALLALWWDGKGDWDKALHRKEGELESAGYWYRRGGGSVGSGDLRVEWEGIVGEMLGRG